jgi:hypothetical protein
MHSAADPWRGREEGGVEMGQICHSQPDYTVLCCLNQLMPSGGSGLLRKVVEACAAQGVGHWHRLPGRWRGVQHEMRARVRYAVASTSTKLSTQTGSVQSP